jgi:hypothetical protein
VKRVHNLQDAIKVSQQSPGGIEVPNRDPASQKKVRDALMVLGATLPDTKRMFGTKDQVDPVRRLIGPPRFGAAIPPFKRRESTLRNGRFRPGSISCSLPLDNRDNIVPMGTPNVAAISL